MIIDIGKYRDANPMIRKHVKLEYFSRSVGVFDAFFQRERVQRFLAAGALDFNKFGLVDPSRI